MQIRGRLITYISIYNIVSLLSHPVIYPYATPASATLIKLFLVKLRIGYGGVTSKFRIEIIGVLLLAAVQGSLTTPILIRAHRAIQWAQTPMCYRTRDTDKKKQRSEFPIHITKLLYLDTHNPAVITTD